MTTPEVIGSVRSTYTWAIRLLCEEKGIAYTMTETPLRAPEILAIHPFGKMPVLRHDGVELFESKAIATYLDHSFGGPRLFPSDPRLLALTEQWVSLVNTLIDRTLIRTCLFAYIAPKTADGMPDREAIEAVMPMVREQVAVLDKAVRTVAISSMISSPSRHQPAADPLSSRTSPGRRRGSRCSDPSGSLLRPARGPSQLHAHQAARRPAAPQLNAPTRPTETSSSSAPAEVG